MQVVQTLDSLDHSTPIAFVPTMGALHAGHAALIQKAKEFSDAVVVSIFINPRQFEDPTDFAQYPRTLQRDLELAHDAGASVIWIPDEENVYPPGFEVIPSPPVGEIFEGALRKGHFSGMLTVVNALFSSVKPKWAIFGEKDFQQLFLVRQMVLERKMNVEIVSVPVVRDADGLALSSRNRRLSESQHASALIIPLALQKAVSKVSLSDARFSLVKSLSQEPGFVLDYAAIIDEDNFEMATGETLHKRALVAGWVNGVRLIDNMAMTSVEE